MSMNNFIPNSFIDSNFQEIPAAFNREKDAL